MNKNLYKVIFSKSRGQMVVVAENSLREGKSTGDTVCSGISVTSVSAPHLQKSLLSTSFRVLSFSVLLILGNAVLLNTQVQAADIQADPSAPKNQQATILNTANGIPQVNIQTPSAAGVSMNQYQKFNVNSNGAILNNSRKNTQTEMGGWVQGNPWLATGEARVIVNQVNSRDPSQLNGYIEVAGQKADVVIANPSGLQVNGAGFINAGGVTLTTGQPIIRDGNLQGYQVRTGQITIQEKGLDGRTTDYTRLLSEVAQINAGIWAKELSIITGQNDIDTTGQHTVVSDTSNTPPVVAIDTSNLGGMYAGKISLISTEKGVGVNNAGQIFAGAGGVSIDANGYLSNSGSLIASDESQNSADTAQINIRATNVNNSGSISAQGNGIVRSDTIDNSGLLLSSHELNIHNQNAIINSGEIKAARLEIVTNSLSNQSGDIKQTGLQDLTLNAGRLNNSNNGVIGAALDTNTGGGGSIDNGEITTPSTATADGSVNQTEVTTATTLTTGLIDVQQDLNNDSGQIIANGRTDLEAKNGFANHAAMTLGNLTVEGETLDNSQGTLNVTRLSSTADSFNNTQGHVQVQETTQIQSNSFNNEQGKLQSIGAIDIDTGSATNQSGQISSSESVQINSKAQWNNQQGAIKANKAVQLNSEGLDNSGGEIVSVQEMVSLNANQGQLNNQSGNIQAATDVTIQAAGLNNNNATISANHIQIDASKQTVNNNAGKIHSQTDITLQSGRLDNSKGQIIANDNLSIHTNQQQLNNQSGKIAADQQVDIQSGAILNQQGQIVANKNVLINTSGQSLNNDDTQNNAGISANVLDIQSGDLSNNRGNITANTAQIDSLSLSNQSGYILANQQLNITSTNLVDNLSGQLQAGEQLTVNAGDIDNEDGFINAIEVDVVAENTISNKNTKAEQKGIQADTLSIRATDLDNSQGQIIANQSLPLTIRNSLNNQQGLIATAQDLTIQSDQAQAPNINNDQGIIQSGNDLTLQAQTLTNSGQIVSDGNIDLDIQGSLQQTGTLATQKSMSLNATAVSNSGSIQVKNQLTAQSQSWNNDLGSIQANVIEFDSGTLSNRDGLIQQNSLADLNIDIQGGLNNAQGVLGAALVQAAVVSPAQSTTTGGSSSTGSTGTTNNTNTGTTTNTGSTSGGQTPATVMGHINVTGAVNNQQGQILANGTSNLDGQGDLSNAEGQIVVNDLNWSNAERIDNQAGQINTVHSNVSAQTVNNQQGQWVSQQQLNITASGDINNNSGQLVSGAEQKLAGKNIYNQQGQITSLAGLDINADQTLDNTSAKIKANQAVNIQTGSLNNNSGEISSATTQVVVKAKQNINNQTGKISAVNQLSLEGQSIDNSSGSLVAKEVALTATSDAINNLKGTIEGNKVTLDSIGLNNQTGTIHSNGQLGINSHTAALNNEQGSITGLDVTTIQSGALNNQQGIIQSNADLSINTHGQKLDNQNTQDSNKGIVSQQTLTLVTGELDNQQGNILATNTTATVDTLYNQSGTMQSAAKLNVTATQDINNQSGSLIAGQDLQLKAADIDNSQTQDDATHGLQANNIQINSQNLNNAQGQIFANQSANMVVSDTVDNQQGKVNAADTLSITGTSAQSASRNVLNANGELLASKQLTLRTQSLDNAEGQIKSKQQLDVYIGSDFQTASGELAAGGDANIEVVGTLTNNDQLQAGNVLYIQSQNLINSAEASINATTTDIEVAGTLTNRGLIDGQQTYIQAKRVDNLGASAKLYGDHLAIKADILNNNVENGQAATIAARERLDIGAKQLINQEQSLIFSAGDLSIAGDLDANHQATGQAQNIQNNSARIESLGDMQINTAELHNTNEHLKTEIQQISQEQIVEYEAKGRDERFLEGTQESLGWFIKNDESDYLHTPDGKRHDRWHKYDYVRTIEETHVIDTAPGQIIAGGDMRITADELWNQDSQIIAGGQLIANVGNLHNEETTGERIVTDVGILHSYWRKKQSGGDTTGHSKEDYVPAPELTTGLSLGTTQYQQYSQIDSTTSQADNRQGVQVTADLSQAKDSQSAAASDNVQLSQNDSSQLSASEKDNYQADDVAKNQTQSSDIQDGGELQQADATQGTDSDKVEIRTIEPNTKIPASGLFAVNAASGYQLIETDPKFIDYRKWLSSDYMLDALSLDPNIQQKRMGDGFYEQRLVNEQISQLTGRRYLDGYSNDEAQFKALMDSGISAAKTMGLVPGIALSPEQIARLTSDIVWLVNQNVTLADGSIQTVLVPQVYVKVRPGDIDGTGALLSGSVAALNIKGDLDNIGTIAGRQAMQINANTVNNINGRLSANKLSVNATEDINNTGGTIDASQQLVLNAGRDINSRSTTTTNTNKQGDVTALNRVAGIYVTGKADGVLLAQAGRNINLTASMVSNQSDAGQTLIKAGQNVNLDTVSTSRHQENRLDADNHVIRGSRTDVGSAIQTTGDLSIVAGQDLNAKAAEVSSEQGQLAINAGRNINLTTGEQYSLIDDASKHTGRSGGGNKQVEIANIRSEEQTAVASNLGGQTVNIHAGQDINVIGSSIIGDRDVQITADNNINISSAEQHYQSQQYNEFQKSGIMSSGIGFTVGSQKQGTTQKNVEISNAASTVGSLTGDTTIIAGKNYKQTGSHVTSPQGDVNILAEKIDVEAAKDQSNSKYRHEMEQKGFTVAVNVPVVTAIENAQQSVKQVGTSNNDRVNAMAAANSAFDSYKAGQALSQLAGVVSDGGNVAKASNVSVSLTYGEQKNSNESLSNSTTAQKSSINAGGQVNLVATGAGEQSDINIVGSDVVGQQGTHLFAEHDVNITAAEQNRQEQSSNKNEGWNAGVSASYGSGGFAVGVTAGGNAGKGTGNGTETSYVASQVGSADSQTTIYSGNATNIIGSQVQGKGIQVDAKELNIESLQNTASYNSKQQNVEGQVTVGYGGASVSGSASKSAINANYASVQDQAGLYAGDDGYQINVTGNTHLKGGLITSTALAEQSGKNSLTTGTLSHEDIRNISEYDAKGISLSGSSAINGGWDDSGIDQEGRTANPVNKSVGIGLDSDHDSAITHSGINTRNISISDPAGQQALTSQTVEQVKAEIYSSTTTDTAKANNGAVANNFDQAKVQGEIDTQLAVSQRFDENRQEVKRELYSIVDEKRAEAAKLRSDKGGYDTEQSLQLEKEAARLNEMVRWVDAGLGAVWGLGDSDMLSGMLTATQMDRVKRAMNEPAEIWFQTCESANTNCTRRQIYSLDDLTPDERKGIVSKTGGVLTVSNPGIFNDRDDALKNASKQNTTEVNQGGLVVVTNPPTGKYDGLWIFSSLPSELMYAGYDKFNDMIGGKLPLTNAELKNQELYQYAKNNDTEFYSSLYGTVNPQLELDISSHSRGGLTSSVALQDINNNQGIVGIPIRKSRFYGTATNVKDYANQLRLNNYSYVGEDGSIYQSGAYSAVHKADPVGRIPLTLGGNSSTGGDCWLCYSHSSYYAEIPPKEVPDKDGNMTENEAYKKYVKKWGTPDVTNPVNQSVPKLIKPDLPLDGDLYDENPY